MKAAYKADVNVDALPETMAVLETGSATPMQPMRREADRYETRMAYEMTERF
jgi:hypothetical protein